MALSGSHPLQFRLDVDVWLWFWLLSQVLPASVKAQFVNKSLSCIEPFAGVPSFFYCKTPVSLQSTLQSRQKLIRCTFALYGDVLGGRLYLMNSTCLNTYNSLETLCFIGFFLPHFKEILIGIVKPAACWILFFYLFFFLDWL